MDNTNLNNIQNDAEIEAFLADKSEDEMLDLFVEKLVIDKGFSDLDQETKSRFASELKESLIARINEAIVSALPDEKLAELDEMFESGDVTAEKVNELVERSGVDMSDPIQKTMLEFREAYLSAGEEN